MINLHEFLYDIGRLANDLGLTYPLFDTAACHPNRRKVNIYLTPKGRSLREVLLPCAAEVSDLATRGIEPADLALAIDLLHRMIINLSDNGDSL